MRTVPKRPVWSNLLCLTAGVIGSPILGNELGEVVAPGSELVSLVGAAAFTAAFLLGFVFWLGIGILRASIRAIGFFARGRLPEHPGNPQADVIVPPGYGAFLFSYLGLGFLAGVTSWLASDASFALALGSFLAVASAWGTALRVLAHHGYLPFFDEA